MKQCYLPCIIVIAALLLCGCETKNEPAPEQLEPTPPSQAPKESPEKPAQPTVKKAKIPTQAFFDDALEGKIDYIKSELAAGVDVNASNPDNQTALMLAAFNGHTQLVEMLIDRGGKVNHLDAVNRTALMYCSSGPFPEMVRLLLDKGAQVNIADNNEGWTALMFAAAEGQVANVKLLLENGEDYKTKDIDGDTARDFALQNGHSQVAKMIEEHAKKHPNG